MGKYLFPPPPSKSSLQVSSVPPAAVTIFTSQKYAPACSENRPENICYITDLFNVKSFSTLPTLTDADVAQTMIFFLYFLRFTMCTDLSKKKARKINRLFFFKFVSMLDDGEEKKLIQYMREKGRRCCAMPDRWSPGPPG